MASQYYRLPKIKKRLNQTTNAMDELLNGYGADVDSFINKELRAHLGLLNAAGTAITLPLTPSTVPPLSTDTQKHADDLVISYLRADQAENPELRDTAEKRFKQHLIREFGYSRDLQFDYTGLTDLT